LLSDDLNLQSCKLWRAHLGQEENTHSSQNFPPFPHFGVEISAKRVHASLQQHFHFNPSRFSSPPLKLKGERESRKSAAK